MAKLIPGKMYETDGSYYNVYVEKDGRPIGDDRPKHLLFVLLEFHPRGTHGHYWKSSDAMKILTTTGMVGWVFADDGDWASCPIREATP